ncbi:pentachlorophenol monooxygenase/3-(3-hydroxy-phenyl)propionate hydroxylase [Saccharopolyspora erythraea NRRL 2338]|uniref:Pentachlorophenol monooxygenase n=2 Tax=Saccharopolyspora erythraea TaxID=1836 RepID=A4FH28_SACEN|nr:FAD-dependent monooxygenase [Saccharopolyspora erythraea]EQD82450.1 pentachlorophenol monooxygenase [Saccharopolyspora erythraea D]PFG97055.1 pentachlorophenol monooxygenase/3-(3-hydroxy-phenyl)propionate hydroxylase [Saccharopolyspora erythraea NRRL 2338]QRK87262.1 FAD-dependent monooxygenase [Saccharopolyspora erythraea]CAM03353.1 pentachlorophenol monooxygenase [Saccharopolyspora erythraea NRRL 2338]
MSARHGRVAVIGNGPVGQTAALLLARWGVPVVVLDRRPERDRAGSRSICQQGDVLDVWESVGAGRRIAAEGLTWTTARTFYRDAELFSHTLGDRGHARFPPFVNLSQVRTEQILDERIAAEPLIEVRWDHEVTELEQDTSGVLLRCGARTFAADYAVACAGGHGDEVRRMLGVTFAGHSFDDRFLICDIRADLPGWAHERRFHFDPSCNPGRQVLIHPCPGSTYRIDWQVPRDYDLAAESGSGALDARIRAVIGDRDYEIVWKTVYRFHSRLADRMRAGRVLLAGDCAHLVAPFGARGLNSGVADAENAAWKIAFALRGWAGEGLLESYHAERHLAARENLAVTTTTMEFLVPHGEAQRERRRRVLDSAVSDPAARAEVDSGRLSEPFWYAASPLTTPAPSRAFAGRPPRGQRPRPGPGVLVPDVAIPGPDRTHVRELARDGFLFLATAEVDTAQVRDAVADIDVPLRVTSLAEIDGAGALASALEARPGEVWLVRPDAHIAAVVHEPSRHALRTALRRALGHPIGAPHQRGITRGLAAESEKEGGRS